MRKLFGMLAVASSCLFWNPNPAGAARSEAMMANGVFFDAAHPEATDGYIAKSSDISVSTEPPGLKVSYAADAKYPGITFNAPAGGWDLSAYSGIECQLYNPGTEPLMVNIRVDNDNGGNWTKEFSNSQHLLVGAGQNAVLPIKFGESWGHPAYKLDPAHVIHVLLYAGGKTPASFVVRELKAVKVVSAIKPPAAAPKKLDNVDVVPKTIAPNPDHDKQVKNQTIGGGALTDSAIGPPPAYQYGDGFVLVKNWDFGESGTIKGNQDLSTHFQFHDQFNTTSNPNYGAHIVAPDAASALPNQPIEGVNTGGAPVRTYLKDSMKTFIVPLNGAKTLVSAERNAGSGSFQPKWTLPNGGSLLGKDLLWETRVRYVTPPYFWFALWTAGDKWSKGAEMDLVETFGYDNGGGPNYTNFDGRYWHVGSVGGTDTAHYGSWRKTMGLYGIESFDPTAYHTWTWLYRKNDTYECYVDGRLCQSGKLLWTLRAVPDGKPLNVSFLFDATWGSKTVKNNNFPLDVEKLAGTFFEWDYSRVYLR